MLAPFFPCILMHCQSHVPTELIGHSQSEQGLYEVAVWAKPTTHCDMAEESSALPPLQPLSPSHTHIPEHV